MTQLKMKDAFDTTDTYLYKLSEKEGFEHFKHVLFFTSHQDTIVPYYSARVQVFKDDLEIPNTGKLLAMNQNIMNRGVNGVTRVDVDFTYDTSSLSSIIGRTAHLMFTGDQKFLHTFVNKYKKIFGEGY